MLTTDRWLGSRFVTEMKSYGIFAGHGCVKNMSRKIDDCDDRSAEDREERRIEREEGSRRLVVAVPRDPQEPARIPLVERSEHEVGERIPGLIWDAGVADAWRPQQRESRAEQERDADPDEGPERVASPHVVDPKRVAWRGSDDSHETFRVLSARY